MRMLALCTALLLSAPCFGNDISDAFAAITRKPVADQPARTIWSIEKLGAPWCIPCRTETVTPWLRDSSWPVVPINVDQDGNGEIDAAADQKYRIESLPTFIVYRNGAEVARYSGVDPKAFGPILERAKAGGQASLSGEATPTPHAKIAEALELLQLKPSERFKDFGCGDGRALIAAAERYGSRAVGVEIDPARAELSREKVKAAGLAGQVEIVEGDATKVDVPADVGFAYLYSEVMADMIPQIKKLDRFISYLHPVPGLPMTQSGDFYIWRRGVEGSQQATTVQVSAPAVEMQPGRAYAIYGGRKYYAPSCNSWGCGMCNEIRRQIAAREHVDPPVAVQQSAAVAQSGCQGGCSRAGCSGCARGSCASGGCPSYSYGYSYSYCRNCGGGDDDDD